MKSAKLTILAAAMAGVVGCSAQQDEPLDTMSETTVTQEEGIPGGSVIQTQILTASVVEIESAERIFVLQDDAGHRHHIIAPSQMVNFPQLAVGDRVRATIQVETVAYLHDAQTAKSDEMALVASAPPAGEKPGLIASKRHQTTAVVTDIDLMNRTASLLFADGTVRVIAARNDVVLTHDLIGKQVVIVVTSAVAVEVTKL